MLPAAFRSLLLKSEPGPSAILAARQRARNAEIIARSIALQMNGKHPFAMICEKCGLQPPFSKRVLTPCSKKARPAIRKKNLYHFRLKELAKGSGSDP